ncbi:hypothetical protein [Streptomyces sp. NPDC059994]|uniref:hypothetical protein n=1 Tax=Streptomyces sp. NPDC059994 TaxID=3347029 RepID=UPI0036939B90
MTDTVTESATADDQAEPSLESAAVERKLIEQLIEQARSFSVSTVVPLKPPPKSVVAPERRDHPGRFHVTFKMIKRQMFGRAGFALLHKRVLLAP